jgi:nucleoside-diphosphate-sugar epimerase
MTGASGLLGRHVVPLLRDQNEIFAVGRTAILDTETMPPIDIATDWSTNFLPKRIDTVIHLAQSARYRDFPEGANEVFAVNLASTARLLDYARRAGAQRFLLASTGGIYRSSSTPISENSEILGAAEVNQYFATKLSAEMLAGSYRGIMDVHVMRIFFMYGLDQQPGMFLPALIRRISLGESVQLNGSNGIRINPIHAKDAARAVAALTKSGGPKTLNVAGSQAVSMRDISEEIGRLLSTKPSFDQIGDSKDLVAGIEAMTQLIGGTETTLTEGIGELVAEYLLKSRKLTWE